MRSDQPPVRVQPDPHLTAGSPDVLRGAWRGDDPHARMMSRTYERGTAVEAPLSIRTEASDRDDPRQVFVGGSRHRLVRLVALHPEVIDRSADQHEGHNAPE